jgi:hypothetical protein
MLDRTFLGTTTVSLPDSASIDHLLRVGAVVPFDGEDESPLVGLLQVEAA